MKNLVKNLALALGLAAVIATVTPNHLSAAPGGNPPPGPTLVKDVDAAGRQPFQLYQGLNVGDGSSTASLPNFFVVPAGKRLVIESISVEARTPGGLGQNVKAWVGVSVAGNSVALRVPVQYHGNFGDQETFIGAQQVQGYADPSTNVTVHVQRGAGLGTPYTGLFVAWFTVSGYLIDIP